MTKLPKYVDLHVLPHVEDGQACERMAQLLKAAGYSTIGLTVPTGLFRERVSSLRQIFDKNGVQTALRVDLAPTSRVELLRSLRRFRNGYDIIGVKCQNPRVAIVASRDRRVDLVLFDPANRNVRFSHSLASLLHGAVELNLIAALLGQTNSSAFASLARAISIAREHRVATVLSSGARAPQMIRGPLQIAALGRTLGLSEKESLEGVSSTPSCIVTRNLEKRSPAYVEEGVKLVIPTRK
jgi:RNase P/RNase MRP subunit p30